MGQIPKYLQTRLFEQKLEEEKTKQEIEENKRRPLGAKVIS